MKQATQVNFNRVTIRVCTTSSIKPAAFLPRVYPQLPIAHRLQSIQPIPTTNFHPFSRSRYHFHTMASSTIATPASLLSTSPAIEFDGAQWYRFNVPTTELRLEITLKIGQCFGWQRVDEEYLNSSATPKSSPKKRKRTKNEEEEKETGEEMLDEAALPSEVKGKPNKRVKKEEIAPKVKAEDIHTMAAAAATSTSPSSHTAASSSSITAIPAAPSKMDPLYVGVILNSLIGIRQTPDDILYTEYFTSNAAATPFPELDAMIRDYFHLPSTVTSSPSASSSTSSSTVRNHDLLLANLYPTWCQKATDRFKFIASVYPGVRVLRQDPLECLFSFICSSNNNIARIQQMLEALRTNFGTKMNVSESLVKKLGGKPFYLFPTLKQLLTIQESDLRSLGFGYRAKFITGSASHLQSKGGAAYLTQLRATKDRPAIELALQEFPGIGPKVAACIALFSMDCLDAIPCDTHVWKIALRDYSQLSKNQHGIDLHKVKNLNATIMSHVGDLFRTVFGRQAGWAHCLLFLAELPEFKTKLKELGIDVKHPPLIQKESKKTKPVPAAAATDSTDED